MSTHPEKANAGRLPGSGTSFPLEEKHPILVPSEEIRAETEDIVLPLTISNGNYEDMPTETEVEETLAPHYNKSGLNNLAKWLITDPKAPSDGLVKYPPTANSRRNETRTASRDGAKTGSFVNWLITDPKKVEKNQSYDHTGPQSTTTVLKWRETTHDVLSASRITDSEDMEKTPGTVPEPQSNASVAVQAEPTGVQTESSNQEMTAPPKGGIGVYIDKQLDSFGKNIVEQEKKNKAAKDKKAAQKKDLVNWFLGKKKLQKAVGSDASETDLGKLDEKTSKFKVSNRKGLLNGIMGKKEKVKDELPEFEVGKISSPTLDGPLTQTDITYAVYPPFIYVRIKFDGEEIVYNVMEPPMGEVQKKRLEQIEKNLEKLISSKIVAVKPEEREDFLRQKFNDIIQMYNWKLTETYKDRMFFYLRKKYLGYDRIEVLMKDHYIEDVSCNGPNNYLYIFHRIYGSIRTTISYGDVELNRFVMRMAQISGRHISILQPIKDIALPDGSRANLTLGTEVTKKGATFTIRKFKERPISPIELIEYNSVDTNLLAYLWTLLYFKRSILVSGGTASGKTTLMNVLCSFIKPEHKIVSLEDTPELNLFHPNWIQSVTRSGFGGESGGSAPASGTSHQGGKTPGDISMYDLLTAALRQRPEYILVGEVRGAEAFTLFQAIAVGHAAMGTIHAGTMRELLSRVESNPMNVPRTLFASMDAVVFPAQVRRNDRNVRRVMQAVEILELDTDGDLVTNPVFRWDAFTDKFLFSGRSHIFEKIEAQIGIKQEEIFKDMESRAAFLHDLRQRGIRDYYEVVEKIREYELNKITARQNK